MKKIKNKIRKTEGFTLIETMIGLMILTIAIVTATSLLIGFIRSNKQIVQNLQAHYLAQEGLEAIRNIRDTNWLNNQDWVGNDSLGMGPIEIPVSEGEVNSYVVGFNIEGTKNFDVNELGSPSWEIALVDVGEEGAVIFLCGDSNADQYFVNECLYAGEQTQFRRHIEISKPSYCFGDADEVGKDRKALCDSGKVMMVKSVVEFEGGEVSLSEILTDWKGGAL